jgi:hypothetical protein
VKRHKEHAAEAATVNADISMPAAGLTGELTAILASCNDRLLDLQKQATEIVFVEVAAVQAAWLKAVMAMAQMAPQESDRTTTARLIEVVNDWFEVVTQAQTALVKLIGKSALAGGQGMSDLALADQSMPPERRKLALVINFPDRRHAA